VILCKELEVTKQGRLFDDYIYFFYLTNEAGEGLSLKAWIGLSIPVDGRWREQHQKERRKVIRMEFKQFVEQFVVLRCCKTPASSNNLLRSVS